jgi:CheY-like chemotaxis protein
MKHGYNPCTLIRPGALMLTVNRAPVRILLVNPNNDFGEVYQCLFEMFGCVVEFAKRGNDALLVSETFRPHAIYMSLRLGDMTGMELAMTCINSKLRLVLCWWR